MAPAVWEWRVHLGAHKTGTTHLQATLWSLRFDLREAGDVYIPCGEARPVLRDLGAWTPARRPFARGPDGELGSRLASLAPADASDPARLLVSEENILGSMTGALWRRPYPWLGRRVAALAALSRGCPLTLFLSIRSFERQRPAAYAAALRHATRAPWIVRRRERLLGRPPPRWTDVLSRIARAAPGVPIRVWRQEDYRADPRPIVSAFVGRELRALPEPPALLMTATATPSAEAVAEVERLVRAGVPWRDGRAWRGRVDAVYAHLPASAGTPFRPLGPGDAARHAEAYAADVAAIRQGWPGCLIEP